MTQTERQPRVNDTGGRTRRCLPPPHGAACRRAAQRLRCGAVAGSFGLPGYALSASRNSFGSKYWLAGTGFWIFAFCTKKSVTCCSHLTAVPSE